MDTPKASALLAMDVSESMDARWQVERPGENPYTRVYLPGEFGDLELESEPLAVRVYLMPDGTRARIPLTAEGLHRVCPEDAAKYEREAQVVRATWAALDGHPLLEKWARKRVGR